MSNERNTSGSPLEEGRRNTEVKRDTDVHNALGPVEGTGAERKPRVSPDTDQFEDETGPTDGKR
jgi:hypothetical protein